MQQGDDDVVEPVQEVPSGYEELARSVPEPLSQVLPSLRVQMGFLVVLLSLYTLYFARELILPMVLAMVLNLLLSPIVGWLHRWHVPRGLSAALVVWAFIGVLAAVGLALSSQASDWAERLPTLKYELQGKTQVIKKSLEQVTEATDAIEEMATGKGGKKLQRQFEVTVADGDDWRTALFSGTSALLAYLLAMLTLLFFLLASGNTMLRKLVGLAGTNEGRHKALEVAAAVQHEISRYLLSITAINIMLGIVVSLVMWALGMPNPWLWGAMLTIMNFLPYIGAIFSASVVTLVAFMTFDAPIQILLPPLLLMFCTTMEGMVITPLLLGVRLSLNPVVIILFILFWGWLWGIAGVLLAVPLMAILKVSCDKIQGPLAPWGRLLSS